MSIQESTKCDTTTQTPLVYPKYRSHENDVITLATAAIRVFSDGSVLPPLRKRIKYDMDYLISVKAAETQRRRQTKKLSETSEQSRVSKRKTKSNDSKQKNEFTEVRTESLAAESRNNPETSHKYIKEEDIKIQPAVTPFYEKKSLRIQSAIKEENIQKETTVKTTAELKEEQINENLNEDKAATAHLVNTKKFGNFLPKKNVMFQVKFPKILEKMSEEKALIIVKLLTEIKNYNSETREQTSTDFLQNVNIVKTKLKQILRNDEQNLGEIYAPRRDYYFL